MVIPIQLKEIISNKKTIPALKALPGICATSVCQNIGAKIARRVIVADMANAMRVLQVTAAAPAIKAGMDKIVQQKAAVLKASAEKTVQIATAAWMDITEIFVNSVIVSMAYARAGNPATGSVKVIATKGGLAITVMIVQMVMLQKAVFWRIVKTGPQNWGWKVTAIVHHVMTVGPARIVILNQPVIQVMESLILVWKVTATVHHVMTVGRAQIVTFARPVSMMGRPIVLIAPKGEKVPISVRMSVPMLIPATVVAK